MVEKWSGVFFEDLLRVLGRWISEGEFVLSVFERMWILCLEVLGFVGEDGDGYGERDCKGVGGVVEVWSGVGKDDVVEFW